MAGYIPDRKDVHRMTFPIFMSKCDGNNDKSLIGLVLADPDLIVETLSL